MSLPCCEKDCQTRQEMRERHGTPESFRRAVMRAYEDLFVTYDEMSEADRRYSEVYARAPEGL